MLLTLEALKEVNGNSVVRESLKRLSRGKTRLQSLGNQVCSEHSVSRRRSEWELKIAEMGGEVFARLTHSHGRRCCRHSERGVQPLCGTSASGAVERQKVGVRFRGGEGRWLSKFRSLTLIEQLHLNPVIGDNTRFTFFSSIFGWRGLCCESSSLGGPSGFSVQRLLLLRTAGLSSCGPRA